MCGRYLTPDETAFERHFSLSVPPDYFQSWNFAPSQKGAVIRMDEDGQSSAELLDWGFQPGWAKRGWINARSETVFSSKAFAPAARKRRCLVPACGWYEWAARSEQPSAKPKQPYLFHLDGFVPFAFAGIWTPQTQEHPAGSFAILTTQAITPHDAIHGRMPVILDPADYADWMTPTATQDLAQKLAGSTFGNIRSYPVSTLVNKPANNDAACIRPLDEAQSVE